MPLFLLDPSSPDDKLSNDWTKFVMLGKFDQTNSKLCRPLHTRSTPMCCTLPLFLVVWRDL